MENATQALLMAGAIMLAIIILSVGVTMYITHDKTAEAITSRWNTEELNKYNSRFWAYEGREDISAQEIVSLVSTSKQKQDEVKIFVKTKTGAIKGNNDFTKLGIEDLSQFLNDHIITTIKGTNMKQNIFSYVKNSIKYNDETGRICEISFEEK